jgi:uncharacterized protein YeaO (DUF488 family)
MKKTSLRIDAWLKEVAPSPDLRRWFSHDPKKWDEFRRRYFAELKQNPKPWNVIVNAASKGRVTLLFSSHDADHNNAVALEEFLEARTSSSGSSRGNVHRAA